MRLNQWMTCISTGLVFASSSIFATSMPAREQLQVPKCLAAHINVAHEVLAENKQFKIIDVQSNDVEKLVLLADQVKCGHFVNLSHKLMGTLSAEKKQSAQNLLQQSAVKSLTSGKLNKDVYEVKHQEEVNAALKEVVADNIWDTLTHLTTFKNRSATKNTG